MSADEATWMDRVAAARRRGDHLTTFDLASEALAAFPSSLHLHHAAILALARSGATRGARARLDRLRDAGALDEVDDLSLALDLAALNGRLHKDAWARSGGARARAHALRSGEAYADAFHRFNRSYPAVNAATMFLAAGEADRARRYARAAVRSATRESAGFWQHATLAEAALVLGDAAGAAAALDRAAALRPGLDDAAATRRQLLFLAEATGVDSGLIEHLPVPAVAYWLDDRTPPMPAGAGEGSPFDPAGAIIFGAVDGPDDVLRAEWLAARGAEVTLVIPCEPKAWLASLGPASMVVGARFEQLLAGEIAAVAVTREGSADDPAALELCRRQARGLARLRADTLAIQASRITWPEEGVSGPRVSRESPAGSPAPPDVPRGGREPRAIVFGDVRGFSRLSEADQLAFLDHVIGGFAAVLEADGPADQAETAGDGIYLVLPDVETAARCCFGLRAVLASDRVEAAGLPPHLGLRLSAHVGPVYRRLDRVMGRMKFCGAEIVRTARIEPVTPVGEIYVTEQFAAVLADAAGERYACDYAGLQPMAKGYGSCRMYALREAHE